jgi:hypothetical protein
MQSLFLARTLSHLDEVALLPLPMTLDSKLQLTNTEVDCYIYISGVRAEPSAQLEFRPCRPQQLEGPPLSESNGQLRQRRRRSYVPTMMPARRIASPLSPQPAQ